MTEKTVTNELERLAEHLLEAVRNCETCRDGTEAGWGCARCRTFREDLERLREEFGISPIAERR